MPATMQKISAVLIVKNEEALLARCLESIKEVDEIVIVDTGSEDKTIEIAKKYTDKVWSDFTWCDDFAKARNHALAKATGDFILSIDADEYLKDFKKVREVVEKLASLGGKVANVTMIDEGTGQQHIFPRIFKRDPEVYWVGAVHNHLSLKGDISSEVQIVYGFSPAHLKDPDRAFRILKKEVARTGNGRETYYLGREYWYRLQYREAIEQFSKYVEVSKFGAEKADAFLIMARCYHAMGMWDEARNMCAQAIIINSHFKEAVAFMVLLAGRGSGNPAWENNANQWEKMALSADNSNVLFVR